MSLRTRLTLVVGLIVALAIAGGAGAAWLGTSNELHREVDRFLLERVERATPEPGFPRERFEGRGPRFVEADALSQVLGAEGDPRPGGFDDALPVDAADRQLAASRSGATRLRDTHVGGEHYRIVTASLVQGGAVQVARSLSETDEVLRSLRNRLLLAAVIGVALAALVAWATARRFTRPIVALTSAAEAVAATQDLHVPVPEAGDDEVGRLARSFNTMLAALAASREQQRRLVTDASHELRTPLTAVRTNLELLARGTRLSGDERQTLLHETTLEVEELGELVAELVELATEARAEEPATTLDLGEIADDVVRRYRRRTDRTITLEIDDVQEIEGRRSGLERAVANLVDNALKFSPAGEPIEVVARGRRVSVLDRGPGVPEDERPLVFDRFYRATATRTMPGSGLGLAIVRQVAEAHRGSAWIEPRDGGGAVATIEVDQLLR